MTPTTLLRACPQRNGCPLVSPRDLRRLDLAPRVRTLALAAGASVLLHLGAMAALAPREAALIAGGGEDAPAALGTSFADFAEGVLSPSEAEPLQMEQAEPIPPDPSAHPEAPHAHLLPAMLPSAPPQPLTAPALQLEVAALNLPIAPDPSAALLPAPPAFPEASTPPERLPDLSRPAQSAMPQDAQTQPPDQAITPPPEMFVASPPETLNAGTVRAEESAAQPVQVQPQRPAKAVTPPAEMVAVAPPEVLKPDTSHTELAPEISRKPLPRPDRTAPAPTPQQARAPQGNSAQTATRGSLQGNAGQSASQAPARAQASAQGNAAASNYPGEVLRRIQRTRQARSPARGQVLVIFTVGNNGNLASVSVARSSGHSGLDQTALDHIRRAAPFPPPPTSAQRQFSFEFGGR